MLKEELRDNHQEPPLVILINQGRDIRAPVNQELMNCGHDSETAKQSRHEADSETVRNSPKYFI